ncbi:MAG: hypothetical protein Q9195_000720 [Heterodermia aff. obscurata]
MNSLNQKNLVSKVPKEIQWPHRQPRTEDTRTIEPATPSDNTKTRTPSTKDLKPTARQILANATQTPAWVNPWISNGKFNVEHARRAIENERRLIERLEAEVFTQTASSKAKLANDPQRRSNQAKRQKAQAEQQQVERSPNKAPRRRRHRSHNRARALKVKEANQKLASEPVVPRTSPRVVRFRFPLETVVNADVVDAKDETDAFRDSVLPSLVFSPEWDGCFLADV